MNELLSEQEVKDFILNINCKAFYTSFSISKGKNRRRRKLQAPCEGLKIIQKKLLKQVLYPNLLHFCHSASMGFMPMLSCRDVALQHTNKRYLIQMDIEDFFPNVTLVKLDNTLLPLVKNGLPLLDGGKIHYSQILALTTIRNPKTGDHYLPQGAPTSPFLSNIAFRLIDKGLSAILGSYPGHLYTYTRYADDLTFSTNHASIVKKLIQGVTSIVKQHGYSINTRKTKITKPNKQQRVLGITVNEGVSVPRKIRRELRAILHRCATTNSLIPPKTQGMLAWIYSVNAEQYARLINRYHHIKEQQ